MNYKQFLLQNTYTFHLCNVNYLINYLRGMILVVCSQPLCSGNVPISRRALQLKFSYSLTPTGTSAVFH